MSRLRYTMCFITDVSLRVEKGKLLCLILSLEKIWIFFSFFILEFTETSFTLDTVFMERVLTLDPFLQRTTPILGRSSRVISSVSTKCQYVM